MTIFEALRKKAIWLGARTNTDWAEEHKRAYDAFDKEIKAAYKSGSISAKEFNELACEAFYDYFELIEEEVAR